MTLALDLAGQRFGRLLALNATGERYFNGERLWLCKCDCGKKTTVPVGNLRSGRTKSCGCGMQCNNNKPRDLTGETFGKLTVIKVLPRQKVRGQSPAKQMHAKKLKWLCKCACGRFAKTTAYQLTHGLCESCGCLNPIRNGNAKKAYANNEILHNEHGVHYHTLRRMAKMFAVSKSAFFPNKKTGRPGWKISCEWNGGIGLPTKRLIGGMGKEEECYHGPTADAALLAKANANPFPEIPGKMYLGKLPTLLNCSAKTARSRLKSAGIVTANHDATKVNGHPCKRPYVETRSVYQLLQQQNGNAAVMSSPEIKMRKNSDGVMPPRNKGGRPRDCETEEHYQFCYREYVTNEKGASTVMLLFNKHFPRAEISETSQVRLYAKRFAKRHNLPRKAAKFRQTSGEQNRR